jgi:hypothetical protein
MAIGDAPYLLPRLKRIRQGSRAYAVTTCGPAANRENNEKVYFFMSKYLTAVLAAFVAASPAVAGPFDTGDSYGPRAPYGYTDLNPTVAEQIARNERHDRQTYNWVRENGGCQADFLPVWIAIHCGETAFGGRENGQMGSEGGE